MQSESLEFLKSVPFSSQECQLNSMRRINYNLSEHNGDGQLGQEIQLGNGEMGIFQSQSQINHYHPNISSPIGTFLGSQNSFIDSTLRDGEKIRQNIFQKQDSLLQFMIQQAEGTQSVKDCSSDLSGFPCKDDDNESNKYETHCDDEISTSRVKGLKLFGKEKIIKSKMNNARKSIGAQQMDSLIEFQCAQSQPAITLNNLNQSITYIQGSPQYNEQIIKKMQESESESKFTRVQFQGDISLSTPQNRKNLTLSKNVDQADEKEIHSSKWQNNLGCSILQNNFSSNIISNNNNISSNIANLQHQMQQSQYDDDDNAFNEMKKQRINRISIIKNNENKISFKIFKRANVVKKFASQLLSMLPSRIFAKLTHHHYNIIGDISYFPDLKNHQRNSESHSFLYNYFRKLMSSSSHSQSYLKIPAHRLNKSEDQSSSFLHFLNQQISVFLPNSTIQLFIQIILLITLALILLISPLLIVFEESRNCKVFVFICEPLAIGIFSLQLLLSINTGFYSEGEIVKSRKKILQRYLSQSFMIDVISIVFFAFSCMNSQFQVLKFISLFKSKQLYNILSYIEEHFQLQQKFYTIYKLSKLYSLVFFVAHYSGCIFYAISLFEYNNNPNQFSWINKQNLQNVDWNEAYLNALYFSFITMITVGYGDLVPISQNEKMYVICFTSVSCGIFAYSVNTIGSIFQELSQKQANYKLKKFEITKYMQRRNIQRVSQIKVLKYLEYMNSQEEERNFLQKGELVLQNISKNLREEVKRDFFGKILQESQIFKLFSKKIIEQLSLLMKEITLGPGDIIFQKGYNDNQLYYVFQGQVEYFLEQNNQIIKFGTYNVRNNLSFSFFNECVIKKEGDFFGQDGFFKESTRTFTAKSKGTTHIVSCNRKDMLSLIAENPLDLEAFAYVKDEMMFKEQYCGYKCLLCGKKSHLEVDCELITMRVNKPLLILKHNYSVDQQRNELDKVKYRKKQKISPYKINFLAKKQLKQLRTAYVLEAFENWDDQIILQEANIGNLGDKEFFLRLPKIKVNENREIIPDPDESIYSDVDIDLISKSEQGYSKDFDDSFVDQSEHSQQVIQLQPQISNGVRRHQRLMSKHLPSNLRTQTTQDDISDATMNQIPKQKCDMIGPVSHHHINKQHSYQVSDNEENTPPISKQEIIYDKEYKEQEASRALKVNIEKLNTKKVNTKKFIEMQAEQ